jgi:pimeloyl-ACP methyl ester carboxylesterase
LHFEVHEGEGPLLLLVHGMLSSRAQWGPNLAALRKVSRPVVVELLGHGRSPAPESAAAYRPDAYVEAFERIRAELGEERWVVCGQSLGAALTLRYALRWPDRVIAQVFTNSISALAEATWAAPTRRAMEQLGAQVEREGRAAIERMPVHPRNSRRLPNDIRDALVADTELHSPEGVVRTGLYTVPESSVRDTISKIRVPTLLVLGSREKRFEAHARYAQEHLPGLEVTELEAGHAVNLEAAGDFDRAVTSFVQAARTRSD